MKIHCLLSHLGYFPENVGAFSKEMGDSFSKALKIKSGIANVAGMGKW